MSSITSQYVTSPTGESEIASCLIIDNESENFTLFDVMTVGEEYTASLWVKSDVLSSVVVNETMCESSTNWSKHVTTFVANSKDLILSFGSIGTYYIYHIKLEVGNIATEWSPAPEDVEEDIANLADKAWTAQQTAEDAVNKASIVEAAIQVLSDCIQTLVRDESGESLMTQVGNGWAFNMGSFNKTLSDVSANLNTLTNEVGSTKNTVDILNQAVDDLGIMSEYVVITTYNDQPCIELGESDSDFKLRITNTEIQFVDGSTIPAYLSNQKLNIEKAEVKNELQFGNFVWKIRSNGNMGLMWKGGST